MNSEKEKKLQTHETFLKKRNAFKFAVFLIISIFILNWAIDNPLTHNFISGYINKQLEKTTQIRTKFNSIDISAAPPEVKFYGTSIYAAGAPEKTLQIGKVSVSISVVDLFVGRFRLGNVSVSNTIIDVDWIVSLIDSLMETENSSQKPPSSFPKNPFLQKREASHWTTDLHNYIATLSLQDVQLNNYGKTLSSSPVTPRSDKLDLQINFTRKSIHATAQTTGLSLQSEDSSFIENADLAIETSYQVGDRSLKLDIKHLRSSRINLTSKVAVNDIVAKDMLISADVQLNGDISNLGSFLDIEDTYGEVNANSKIAIQISNSSFESMAIKGEGTSNGAILFGMKLLDSKFEFEVTDQAIIFSTIKFVHGSENLASANGIIKLNDTTDYNFSIRPKNLHLSKLLDIIGPDFTVVEGIMEKGVVNIEGRGDPFKMKILGPTTLNHLTFSPTENLTLTDKGPPDCDAFLDLEVDGDMVKFGKSRLECLPTHTKARKGVETNTTTKIDVNGYVHYENGIRMNVSARSNQLSTLSPLLGMEISGTGRVSTSVKGPYDKITVAIKTDIDDFSFLEVPFGKSKSNISFPIQSNLVTIRDFESSLGDNNKIDISKSAVDLEKSKISIKINGQNMSNEQLTSILKLAKIEQNIQVKSLETIKGEVTLSFEDLDSSSIELDSKIIGLDYADESFLGSALARLKLTSTGMELNVESAAVTEKLILEGKLSIRNAKKGISKILAPENQIESKIRSKISTLHPSINGKKSDSNHIHDPSRLSQLPYVGEHLLSAGIGGNLSVEGQLFGTIENMSGFLNLNSTKLYMMQKRIPPIQLQTFIEQGVAKTILKQGGGTILGQISTDLNTLDHKSSLFMKNTNLSFLLPTKMSSDPRNFIYLSGQTKLDGNWKNFWDLDGNLSIDKILFNIHSKRTSDQFSLKGATTEEVSFTLKSGKLIPAQSNSFRIKHNYGEITVNTRKTHFPNSLDINIAAQTNIDFLEKVFPVVENSKGVILANIDITGLVNKPRVEANILSLPNPKDQGKFPEISIASIRPSFKSIDFEVNFSDQILRFERLTAVKGSGFIAGEGFLSFDEKTDSNFNLEMDEGRFLYNLPIIKNTEAFIDADLQVTGKGLPFTVSGKVDIARASANKNVDLRSEILTNLVKNQISDQSQLADSVLELDLEVTSKDSIFIENKSIHVNLGQNLEITGPISDIKIAGNITVANGKFRYKRDYNVTRGIISFDNAQTIDPNLDIVGVSEISNYIVTVAISGKSSDPQVEFGVDPQTKPNGESMTQLDILILMATGKIPEENQNLTTQDTFKYEAINIFMGNFDEPIERIINFTGQKLINQIYFDTYPSSIDGKLLIRANAPINTGNELDLTIQGDQEKVGLKAEYDLEESISTSVNYSKLLEEQEELSGDKAQDIDASIDLRFRFLFP